MLRHTPLTWKLDTRLTSKRCCTLPESQTRTRATLLADCQSNIPKSERAHKRQCSLSMEDDCECVSLCWGTLTPQTISHARRPPSGKSASEVKFELMMVPSTRSTSSPLITGPSKCATKFSGSWSVSENFPFVTDASEEEERIWSFSWVTSSIDSSDRMWCSSSFSLLVEWESLQDIESRRGSKRDRSEKTRGTR